MVVGPVVCVVVGVVLIAPILIAVVMSFTSESSLTFPPRGLSLRWYSEVFTSSVWTSRIPVSVEVALGTTVLSTVLGTLCAIGISRRPFRGRGLVTALLMAPLIVPVVVLATGEFFVMANGWQVGSFSIGGDLVGTTTGLVLGHTVLALPYPTLLIATALRGLEPELDLAAMSLGAGAWSRFRRVTLPLVAPSALAGAMFAFITSWDEVVIAQFISSGRTSTIPVQIYNELQFALNPTAAAISTMLLAVALSLITLLTVGRRLFRLRQRRAITSRPEAPTLIPEMA
jgi:putative spermidine/putrescine transport system permease protein